MDFLPHFVRVCFFRTLSAAGMAACLLLVSAAPGRGEDALSYTGSATVGTGVLYEGAIAAFEKKTGIRFQKVDLATGTGKGIGLVLDRTFPISGSTRPLTSEEKEAGLVETVIGYDALGLWVHGSNPVMDLTQQQLRDIYLGRILNWKEVGGKDRPIKVYIEPPLSQKGTLTFINEVIMGMAPYPDRHLVVPVPRDGLLAVSGEEGGLTAASLAIHNSLNAQLKDRVHFLRVNGVPPSITTIRDHTYLLHRTLSLVTRGTAKGAAREFVDFILSPEGQAIVARNFLPVR